MNVVTKRLLQAFWTVHPGARGPLTAWYNHARAAEWRTPQDIKNDFRKSTALATALVTVMYSQLKLTRFKTK